MNKVCTKCKEEKPLNCFKRRYDYPPESGKVQSWCRSCTTVRDAETLKKKKADDPTLAKRMYDKVKSWTKGEEGLAYHRRADLKRYWNSDRRDKQLEYQRGYRKSNRDKISKWSVERRVRKIQAMPIWLTEEHNRQIGEFYTLAKECEILTGDKYHVDHIVPLKGKNVCGLHVPWNLQVLPADVNIRKGNRYENGGN